MARTTFMGRDVSKRTIAVAVASDEAREPTRYLGRFPNTPDALRRLCKRLRQDGGELYFCYEAGPFGYALRRRLERWGHRCDVIAPSLIPVRPGDRVKTDRRGRVDAGRRSARGPADGGVGSRRHSRG